jgi:hypothetical protein
MDYRPRGRSWLALALAALSVVALSASAATAATASAETTWLCKPGITNNPCVSSEETTVELGNGSRFVEHAHPAKHPPIDCFYVYPTVSDQLTPNANLNIEGEETQIAIDQASRFSQTCNVYAPMYPQLTIPDELAEVGTGTFNQTYVNIAYQGVLAAWHEYLAKYNHGRGVVLIGHSQGAGMLRKLIKEEIDPSASQHHLLVSALLMGGNVSVPEGKTVGGDFQHVPACQAAFQTHCVVAYSTFLNPPPLYTLFGVVNGPVAALGGGPASGSNLQVLCVNPTLLAQTGRSGPLLSYQSTKAIPGFLEHYLQVPAAPTPWVATPGQYTAQCKHSGEATWLQATDVGPAGDPREQLAETLGPSFGLHLEDINIALGNLVGVVSLQSLAYQLGD